MQIIKKHYTNERLLECSSVVIDGSIEFNLTEKGQQVFKTVDKGSAVFSTTNEHFVYSFSDLEVSEDQTKLKARIYKQDNKPANNIKVYLAIKGESVKNPLTKSNIVIVASVLVVSYALGLVLIQNYPEFVAMFY